MPGASHPASKNAHSFANWIRQTQLNDWRHLLIQAGDEIAHMAGESGIDWNTLRQQLPACGSLLKGNRVPVLAPRDRGRNAFVWHLNTNRYGDTWPCLVFMSFRHGGVHQIFHGYRWAWLRFTSGRPPASPAHAAAGMIASASCRRHAGAWRGSSATAGNGTRPKPRRPTTRCWPGACAAMPRPSCSGASACAVSTGHTAKG